MFQTMNSNYRRGRSFEYLLKKDLESQGWTVTRASGSRGCYDLIALRENEQGEPQVALFQCKVCKTDKVNPLIKQVRKTLLFKPESFDQFLAVKITGKKQYILYKYTE